MNSRLAFAALLCVVSAAAEPQPVVADGPEGIDSGYSDYLSQVLKHWSPAQSAASETLRVTMTCVATANADRYVGMIQQQTIDAPIAAVTEVLDDIDHYQDLFPGTVKVRIREGSLRVDAARPGSMLFATAWVQRAPIPFLPEIRFEMSHLVEKAPARVVYRYKLLRGDKLTASDGLVVLEAIGATRTRFTEYDFFDGHWGPLPTWLVWKESLKGAYHSDLAVRFKAEQPGWSYAHIAAEAERLTAAESERLERCFAERRIGLRSAAPAKAAAGGR